MSGKKYESIDSVDVKIERVEKFKGETGHIYRGAFTNIDGKGRVLISMVEFFTYTNKEGKFYSWVKSENEELNKKAQSLGATEQPRYVTPLLKYTTDMNGRIQNPLSWSVKPIVLSSNKVLSLKVLNEEFNISKHDLKLRCTDAKFQNFDFSSSRISLWQLPDGDPDLKKVGLTSSITKEVKLANDECVKIMENSVASVKSDEQIMFILTGGQSEDTKKVESELEEEFGNIESLDDEF